MPDKNNTVDDPQNEVTTQNPDTQEKNPLGVTLRELALHGPNLFMETDVEGHLVF